MLNTILLFLNNNQGLIALIGIAVPIFLTFVKFIWKGFFNHISGNAKKQNILSTKPLLDTGLSIKQKMKSDLLRENPREYNPNVPQEDLPEHAKFIHSEIEIVDIDDQTVTSLAKDNKPASYNVISPIDFYDFGLIGYISTTTSAYINDSDYFFIPGYKRPNSNIPNGFKEIHIRMVGYIAFSNIMLYEISNESEGRPTLFCKYAGIKIGKFKTPFSKIEYVVNGEKRDYLKIQLDLKKLIPDTWYGWLKFFVSDKLSPK